jgi:imidazolonepropionase-like amidohydrolase
MSRLLLTDVNVFDGEQVRRDGTVVVDGERILDVLDSAPPAEPEDRVVSLGGRTVMPGMFSCHFHSTYRSRGQSTQKYRGGDAAVQRTGVPGNDYPPAYEALICEQHLQMALDAGYTGVVGAGASNDVEPGVKQALEDGFIRGPRLWPSGRELSTTGHANDFLPWYWMVSSRGGIRLCDGAEGFRLGVREEIKKGAEVIKLFVTGGHGVRAPKDRMEMTTDELKAAIETAHSREALVRGHIVNKRAILLAIELGIDLIDHCDDIDDEVIAALAETGTFVVPSVLFPKLTAARLESSDPETAATIRQGLERVYEALPKADIAGVKLLLGDDYGGPSYLAHGQYGEELHTYVEDVGISPLSVLRWATRHGAELVRRPDLGAITPGATADLLVVDGDPSADIGLLADKPPVAVLLAGEVVVGSLAGSTPR